MTDSRQFTNLVFKLIFLTTVLLGATNSWAQMQEDPDIVIIANGSAGVVNLNTIDDLFIQIELDPFSSSGVSADWWIIADVGIGNFYYYDLDTSLWMEGMGVGKQGPLFDFELIEILDLPPPLPAGTFTFYFGVDTIPNGEVDVGNLFYSFVTVNITEASTSDFSMISPYTNANDIDQVWPFFANEHSGLDFQTNEDLKPFRAATAGTVELVELNQNGITGLWQVDVRIRIDETYSMFYGFEPFTLDQVDGQTQLDNIAVSPGQTVAQGDLIGLLFTAIAPGSGPHVHFHLEKLVPVGDDPFVCPELFFTDVTNAEILTLIQRFDPQLMICN